MQRIDRYHTQEYLAPFKLSSLSLQARGSCLLSRLKPSDRQNTHHQYAMHGVLCAFYMAVIVAVNREMVKKDIEQLAETLYSVLLKRRGRGQNVVARKRSAFSECAQLVRIVFHGD